MQVKCSFCGGVQTKNSSSSCSCCGYFIELEFASDYYKSSLKGELGNLFAIAETALEARNWQEAIHYFNRILEKDIANPDAWFGKAVGVVNTSSLANFKFNQAIAYWENAIKYAPNPIGMRKRVAMKINDTVIIFYIALEKHFLRFITLDNSYFEFLKRFFALESALDYALQLDPENHKLVRNGLDLCQRVGPKQISKNISVKMSKEETLKFSRLESLGKLDALIELEGKYLEKMKIIDPKRSNKLSKIQKSKDKEGGSTSRNKRGWKIPNFIKSLFPK